MNDIRKQAAVLGSPIAHSKSPALHRAAYNQLGLDWTYGLFDVNEAQLPDFIAGLDSSWAGLSLTMPLKEVVIDLLDDVTDFARTLRSVNTVLPGSEPDTWRGTNTDVQGIVASIREAAGTHAIDGQAVVLGSGATARSAIAALPELGVKSAVVCARRHEAAEEVQALARHFGVDVTIRDLSPDADLMGADLLVSTLPGDAAAPWAAVAPRASGVLLDASYHPWPTPLASAWSGRAIASGRDMLLWQAVEQVRLMTGCDPDPQVMRAAMEASDAQSSG